MAGLMYGADADELEAIAKELEGYEQELGQLLREGVGAVSLLGLSATLNTIWMGPRSSEFAALWQSRHLLRIRDVQSTLSAAASDLRKNAREQVQASGGKAPVQDKPREAGPGGGREDVRDGGERKEPPETGARAGALPGTNRSMEQVAKAYRENWTRYGLYAQGADGGSLDYECVSWAWFRMKELGYEPGTIRGHGGELAGNLGGTVDTIPKPGAVMSHPVAGSSYGHVVIAEEVYTDESGTLCVRVSEMNVGIPGKSVAEEYKSTRVLKQNADGTWQVWGKNVSVTVFNPNYGSPKI